MLQTTISRLAKSSRFEKSSGLSSFRDRTVEQISIWLRHGAQLVVEAARKAEQRRKAQITGAATDKETLPSVVANATDPTITDHADPQGFFSRDTTHRWRSPAIT